MHSFAEYHLSVSKVLKKIEKCNAELLLHQKLAEEGDQVALKYFTELSEIAPGNDEVWKNKGNALYFTKKYGEAIECFDKALAINTNNERASKNRDKARILRDRLKKEKTENETIEKKA